jgi:hypothetical protein
MAEFAGYVDLVLGIALLRPLQRERHWASCSIARSVARWLILADNETNRAVGR